MQESISFSQLNELFTLSLFCPSKLRPTLIHVVYSFCFAVDWQSRVTVDPSLCMDSAILIDALMLVLSDMNNRLTHSAVTVIRLIRDTFQLIFPPQTVSFFTLEIKSLTSHEIFSH